MLFKSFYAFRCVGHSVSQAVDPHFDPYLKVHFCNEKHPKSEDFRCFLELLTRFELVTSSLPTTVEPSSPCCIRLCGVFLSKKDEVAACLFHCFRPLISPCGSRCGSELLQDMNKGPAFGNGNPPILLIADKRLKLHGTYSVSSIPQAWQKMK